MKVTNLASALILLGAGVVAFAVFHSLMQCFFQSDGSSVQMPEIPEKLPNITRNSSGCDPCADRWLILMGPRTKAMK
eukprot:3233655-Amphidinium_carterae.3